MANYVTCTNCARDKSACVRREEIRAMMAGHSVQSIKFRCDLREPLYKPGQRVSTEWGVSGDDYEMPTRELWPGTVIAETADRRFVVRVDDVASDEGTPARGYFRADRLYVKCPAGRMKLLDEPPRPICTICGEVEPGLDECWQRGIVKDSHCLAAGLANG